MWIVEKHYFGKTWFVVFHDECGELARFDRYCDAVEFIEN